MSERSAGSDESNRRAPNGRMNNRSSPFGESSDFETGRDFAASREEYAFEEDENEAFEDEEETGDDDALHRQEFNRLMNYSDPPDYYSLLGLSRNPPPSDSQIRSTFHALSLSFHPDKQPEHLRGAAREQYAKLQRAYATLLDPQKRVVYDLLGEEGVRSEWSAGGVMGKNEERQVGVKTMTSEEFRRWFLAVMKSRERAALENMVGSRGKIVLSINGVPFFQRLNFVPRWKDNSPRAVDTSFRVRHSFKAPLTWMRSAPDPGLTNNTSPYQTFQPENSRIQDAEAAGGGRLAIHAGIDGYIRYPRVTRTFKDEVTNEIVTREDTSSPLLYTNMFSLESNYTYIVPESPSRPGPMGRVWSFMQGSALEVGASLLSGRTFQAAISKNFTPVSGTRPLRARLQTSFKYPVQQLPPDINISLARSLSPGQEVFCSWASGGWLWHDVPVIRQVSLFLGMHIADGTFYDMNPSKFLIGYTSRSRDLNANIGDSNIEEEEEQEEQQEDSFIPTKSKSTSQQTWGFAFEALQADSGLIGLSINYSRNLFGGSIGTPLLSSWSAEGHHTPHQALTLKRDRNPVRLEIQTTVGLDMSMGLMVRGTRKVGDFTRMGLGVRFESGSGVTLTVNWSRLGQSLDVPIAVCPPDLVTPEVVQWAIILPWTAFVVVEFGFLRPRARRKWRKALKERQNELKKLVALKRSESAQAIELMASQVKRRQNGEASKDGLVIIHAEYGISKSKNSKGKGLAKFDESVDVTIPVASLVDRGQLSIRRKVKKSHILGFYDPAPLSRKTLRVRYRFGGAEHFVEVDENENLVCPMQKHRLSSVYELD